MVVWRNKGIFLFYSVTPGFRREVSEGAGRAEAHNRGSSWRAGTSAEGWDNQKEPGDRGEESLCEARGGRGQCHCRREEGHQQAGGQGNQPHTKSPRLAIQ